MEFVLFLLAGFLSLTEGQSELLSVEYVIRHMTCFHFHLAFICQPNISQASYDHNLKPYIPDYCP